MSNARKDYGELRKYNNDRNSYTIEKLKETHYTTGLFFLILCGGIDFSISMLTTNTEFTSISSISDTIGLYLLFLLLAWGLIGIILLVHFEQTFARNYNQWEGKTTLINGTAPKRIRYILPPITIKSPLVYIFILLFLANALNGYYIGHVLLVDTITKTYLTVIINICLVLFLLYVLMPNLLRKYVPWVYVRKEG